MPSLRFVPSPLATCALILALLFAGGADADAKRLRRDAAMARTVGAALRADAALEPAAGATPLSAHAWRTSAGAITWVSVPVFRTGSGQSAPVDLRWAGAPRFAAVRAAHGTMIDTSGREPVLVIGDARIDLGGSLGKSAVGLSSDRRVWETDHMRVGKVAIANRIDGVRVALKSDDDDVLLRALTGTSFQATAAGTVRVVRGTQTVAMIAAPVGIDDDGTSKAKWVVSQSGSSLRSSSEDADVVVADVVALGFDRGKDSPVVGGWRPTAPAGLLAADALYPALALPGKSSAARWTWASGGVTPTRSLLADVSVPDRLTATAQVGAGAAKRLVGPAAFETLSVAGAGAVSLSTARTSANKAPAATAQTTFGRSLVGLTDPAPPTVSVAPTRAWSTPENATVEVTAADTGSGIERVVLDGAAPSTLPEVASCFGASAAPCPAQKTASLPVSGAGPGESTVRVIATDASGLSTAAATTIRVDAEAPTVAINGVPTTPLRGPKDLAVTATGRDAGGSGIARIDLLLDGALLTSTGTCDGDPCTATVARTIEAGALPEGMHQLTARVEDRAGHASTTVATIEVGKVNSDGENPPDAGATPLSQAQWTTPKEAYAFLFEGDDPAQRGADRAKLVDARLTVLRGKVLDEQGRGVDGVEFTVDGHPEFGTGKTFNGGEVHMLVNGGGRLLVHFNPTGGFAVDRVIQTKWGEYSWLDDVVITKRDTKATPVDFGGSVPEQHHVGSETTDAQGPRTPRLWLPPGIEATAELADGSTRPISSSKLRVTEYTVGERGKAAMPAALPPRSGYTYAAEYELDQARLIGAQGVRFSKPLYSYLENFIGVPVGSYVPYAIYDRAKARWVPQANGIVLRVVSESDGVAVLSRTPNGSPMTGAEVDNWHLTPDELKFIAAQYAPGDTFWRVPVTHFSPADLNYLNTPGLSPDGSGGGGDGGGGSGCESRGSITDCLNRTVQEQVDIPGAPFGLVWDSSLAKGDAYARTIDLTIGPGKAAQTGSSAMPIHHLDVSVEIAGRRFTRSFDPKKSQTVRFVWDGKDAFGRRVPGGHEAKISMINVYSAPSVMGIAQDNDEPPVFGRWAGWRDIAAEQRSEFGVGRWQSQILRVPYDSDADLGGWKPDVWNRLDPAIGAVVPSDSRRRPPAPARNLPRPLELVQGGNYALSVAKVLPDGTIIGSIPSWRSHPDALDGLRGDLLVALHPNGSSERLAGGGENDDEMDGAPATDLWLHDLSDITVDPDGRIVFVNWGAIYRLEKDGTVKQLAGLDIIGCQGSGGGGASTSRAARARQALPCVEGDGIKEKLQQQLLHAKITYTSDSSLWIAAENFGQRLVRIDENGQFEETRDVVPDGVTDPNVPTYDPSYRSIRALLVTPRDEVIVHSTAGLSRVRADGTIDELSSSHPAGGEATTLLAGQTLAELGTPSSVEIGPDDTFYFGDERGGVYKLDPGEGSKTAVIAGTGKTRPGERLDPNDPDRADIMLAFDAVLPRIQDLAIEPSGALVVVAGAPPGFDDVTTFRVDPKKSGLGNEIRVPSADGSQIYVFDQHGLQLETRDALTSAIILTFEYDAKSRLTAIVEATGDRTTINRDADGKVTGLSRNGDEVATLGVNDEGLLDWARPVEGAYQRFSYDDRGLLTYVERESGANTELRYDAIGRLTDDISGDGRSTHLTGGVPADRGPGDNKWFALDDAYDARKIETTKTDGEGRVTHLRAAVEADGSRTVAISNASGQTAKRSVTPGGLVTVTSPDGTVTEAQLGEDSGEPASSTATLPSGKKLEMTTSTRRRTTPDRNVRTLQDRTKIGTFEVSSQWNAGTRDITRTSGAGRTLKITTDAAGDAVRYDAAKRAPVEIERTARGDVARIKQGDRQRTMTWSADGNLKDWTDPLGRKTAVELENDGAIAATINAAGGRTEFRHDLNGQPSLIRTPEGRTWTPEFSAGEHLIELVAPWDTGRGTRFRYDTSGLPTATIASDGTRVDQSYDSSGRLQRIDADGATTSVAYTGAGQQPASFERGDERVAYDYDGAAPVGVRTTGRVPSTLELEYNDDLEVRAETVNGSRSEIERDRDGLLTASGPLSIQRDAETGDETGTSAGKVSTTSTWSQYGELVGVHASADGSTVLDQQIERRKDGTVGSLREQTAQDTRTLSIEHDSLGRITSATDGGQTRSFEYDADGNRTKETLGTDQITATFNAAGQLTARAGSTYSYDQLGRLTRRERSGGEHLDLTYAGLGDVKSIRGEDGVLRTFRTDAAGRTVEESVDGIADRRWAYGAGPMPAALLNADSSVATRFIYGTRQWVPDLMIRDGKTYRLVRDQRESVRAVVDVESGTVVQERDYDLWGRVTRDSAPGFQPFGFAGGIDVPATGLVRIGVRLYDPEVGRFTTPDPMALASEELNPYVYVGNDPLSYADPSGYFLGIPSLADMATSVLSAGLGFLDDLTGGLASKGADHLLPDYVLDVLCADGGYDVGKVASTITSVIPAKAVTKTIIKSVAKVVTHNGATVAKAGRAAAHGGRANPGNAASGHGHTPGHDTPSPANPGGGTKPTKSNSPDGTPPKPQPGPKKPDDANPGRTPNKVACAVATARAAAGAAAACAWETYSKNYRDRYLKSPFGQQVKDLQAAGKEPEIHHTIPKKFEKQFEKFDIHHPCLTTAIGRLLHRGSDGLHEGPQGGAWNSEFRDRVLAETNKDINLSGTRIDEEDFPKVLAELDKMAGLEKFGNAEFAEAAYGQGDSTNVPMNRKKKECGNADFLIEKLPKTTP